MEDIKVSVIVPIYNQEVYLRDCLDSLKRQTLQEIEFILINDGSTDNSIDIINEYARDDSRFIVVDKENGGVAVAINTGNQMARGEYLAELDSDDYVADNMYEELYNVAKKNDLDIIKSNLINFTGSSQSFLGTTQKIVNSEDFYGRVIDPSIEAAVFSFPIYAWTALYRRNFIIDNEILWNDKVSSFNDNGFFWQTMTLAKKVMYVDKDLVYHRRDNEGSTVKDIDKLLINFFKEHEFITKKLIGIGSFELVKRYFFERKINNYLFALERIPFDEKRDFIRKISKDFDEDIKNYGLREVDFINPKNKSYIFEIVDDPDRFFYQYIDRAYKVSVVIPICDAEPFLETTLERITNQTLKSIEIILVENGSSDASIEIIKAYAARDPRIVWTSIGPSNAGHARNVGLSMAHGEYIIFLDADDFYSIDLLRETSRLAKSNDADVVWFKTEETNALTGLSKVHTHAFRKDQIPEKKVFSFSEIKGNPYDAIMGWPWDKLYKLEYIKRLGIKYQELPVANDGYFNFIAMSKAKKIVCLDKILVSRIIEHGNNISMNKHDINFDAQLQMICATYNKLKQSDSTLELADQFRERSIQLINWMFKSGLKTKEGASKYFDLLLTRGIADLELDEIDEANVVDYRKPLLEKILKIKNYQVGDYGLFIREVGGDDFLQDQHLRLNIYPNVPSKKILTGRLIFGQTETRGTNKLAPWFNIIISYADTSNVSAAIDISYMGNYTKLIKDTLFVSISLQEKNGNLTPQVHQVEWENGDEVFTNNIFYSFIGNVFTIYAQYPEQFSGFTYAVRNISSREGKEVFSVNRAAVGFRNDILLEKTNDIIPVKNIRLGFSPLKAAGNRIVFRNNGLSDEGQDLCCITLAPYQRNNVVLSISIGRILNNKPATFDTLYIGVSLKIVNNEPQINIFQVEWEKGKKNLKGCLYYYTEKNKLYLGVKFTKQYEAFNYKIETATGRELCCDFEISRVAPELIDYKMPKIPEQAKIF